MVAVSCLIFPRLGCPTQATFRNFSSDYTKLEMCITSCVVGVPSAPTDPRRSAVFVRQAVPIKIYNCISLQIENPEVISGGRNGPHQVVMAFMRWAEYVLQWGGQLRG